MDEHVALMDSASADKYTYTSPDVASNVELSPDWPTGATVSAAASYGWHVDQMKRFQDPEPLKPILTFVETAKSYLNEPGARSITPDEIEGAVWSAIIHEARGIAYFQNSNDTECSGYSLIECSQDLKDKVEAINAKVTSLVPVFNTQSYEYDFDNGTDTMLKTYADDVYMQILG